MNQVFEGLKVFTQAYRVIFRHLTEELINAILDKIEHHLRLTHAIHNMTRNLMIEMVVYIYNRNVLAFNELSHSEKRVTTFETDGFGFRIERKNNPAVIAVIIGNNDRSPP